MTFMEKMIFDDSSKWFFMTILIHPGTQDYSGCLHVLVLLGCQDYSASHHRNSATHNTQTSDWGGGSLTKYFYANNLKSYYQHQKPITVLLAPSHLEKRDLGPVLNQNRDQFKKRDYFYKFYNILR